MKCEELEKKVGAVWKAMRTKEILENITTYEHYNVRVFKCPWCGVDIVQDISEDVDRLICKGLQHMYKEYLYTLDYMLNRGEWDHEQGL